MGGGNEERGVLINEKPNQGIWESKKVGNRSQMAVRLSALCVGHLYSLETFFCFWYSLLLEAE
jgi:hypothetical protein